MMPPLESGEFVLLLPAGPDQVVSPKTPQQLSTRAIEVRDGRDIST